MLYVRENITSKLLSIENQPIEGFYTDRDTDLILTNKRFSFQNSCVAETGLSEFHRMILTVTKMTFQKLKPGVINYRDYKHFNNESFRDNLLSETYLEFDNKF